MNSLAVELASCGAGGPAGYGFSPIFETAPGRFEPSGNGPLAMILADDPVFPVEAVAFHHRQPSRWWLRTGGSPIIGGREIEEAALEKVPLLVCASPLSWLRRRRPAICIVAWDRFNPHRYLSDIGVEVIPETEAVATRLQWCVGQFSRPRFKTGKAAA